MKTETIKYKADGKEFLGYLAYNSALQERRPAIIIAHAWRGQEKNFQQLAEKFAAEGYVGFAADVYGERKIAKDTQEATDFMLPLFVNRQSLRSRIVAAFDTVAKLPQVDPNRIVAVGFCFGGLTVVELLRSGANVRGVVSIHGVYGIHIGDTKAIIAPNAKKIMGALLVLHGVNDPLVPYQDLLALQSEMTNADVNWQINIYSKAAHAFTNEEANDVTGGMFYEPIAANRSFKSMYSFFEEVLS